MTTIGIIGRIFAVTAVLVLAGMIGSARGAISLVGTTDFAVTDNNGNPGDFTESSGVYSYPFTAGVTSDVVVVALSAEKSTESYSVSYGGTSLSLAIQSSSGSGASIWYLTSPGASGNIEIDFSGVTTMNGFGIGIASLSGDLDKIVLHSTGFNTGASSVDITTSIADAFVIVAGDANSTAGSEPVMNAPLTLIGRDRDVGSSAVGFGYQNSVAVGTPHTYSWVPDISPRGMAAAAFLSIPEPSTLILAGLGLMGLIFRRRRGGRRISLAVCYCFPFIFPVLTKTNDKADTRNRANGTTTKETTMNTRTNNRSLGTVAALVVALFVFAAGSAFSATYTWTGGNGATPWYNASNWSGAGVPSQSTRLGTTQQTDVVVFDSETAVGGYMPTDTILVDTDWNTSEHLQPTVRVLNGTINFGSGDWWIYGGASEGLQIGDGDTTTAAQVNSGHTNWTRHIDKGGPNKITINADGTMNQTANFQFSSSGSLDTQMTLNGGTFTSSGTITGMAGDSGDYAYFAVPGSTFTALYGGDFANVSAVTAEIGATLSFRSGVSGSGIDFSAADGGTTFTVSLTSKGYEWQDPAGGGSWNATNWNLPNETWGGNGTANFVGAGGVGNAVDVTGSVDVYAMNFADSSSYLIDGTGALNFGYDSSINTGTGTPEIAASLTGTGDLTKTGSGTLTVTGDVSGYSGTLAVTDGTLDLDSSGSFGGDLLIGDGDHLATNVGDTGTINLGGGTLTLLPGAHLDIDLIGGTSDLFGADGDNLVLPTGTVTLNLAGSTVKGQSYTLFAGGVSNFSGTTFAYTGLTGNWTVFEGSSLILFNVPEPSTMLLAGLGLMGVCFRRRRRQ